MKLSLLLVVLVATVFMVNCRDYTDGPDKQAYDTLNSNFDGEQLTTSTELQGQDSFVENPLTYFENQQLKKDVNKENQIELRGKAGKGTLKTLIKNLKSMEYNLTKAYKELQMELQAVQKHQYNTRNINTEINKYLKGIKDNQENITDINTDLKMELVSFKDNITRYNSKESLKLDAMRATLASVGAVLTNHTAMLDSLINGYTYRDCPRDMFLFGTSKDRQCFKFFTDSKRSWSAANSKCRAEKLVLAEPKDPISLRAYLVTNYNPDNYAWLGARGDGRSIKWLRGGNAISNTSPLWNSRPGSRVTTNDYLFLLTTAGYLKSSPSKPYYSNKGTFTMYSLCELVLN